MSVNVEIPYEDLEGNGVLTTFAFSFGIVENADLIVLVDGVLQIEYSDYTIENLTADGGEVEFTEAPTDELRVLLLRKTTITQNVDYESGEPFPAETHEWNLDKITYILQELISGAFGGIDSDGNPVYLSFDLDVEQGEFILTVTNTGGTNAALPVWVSGTYAGTFIGELTTSAPADEASSTKPDGYVYLEYTP